MAAKLGDLYVQVSSKGVSQVNAGLQQTEQRANLAAQATNLLKTAILGLGAYGVINAFKRIVGLYIQQEKALAKLSQQLKNHNEYTQENIDALTNQAKALQQVTIFSDDEIVAAQAMLASFNLTTEQIKLMTPRMLDVAVMTENTTGQMQDLATTAKMVGVALSGQPGRLAQMGIKLSELEKRLYTAANEQEKFNLLLQIFDNNAKGLAESVGKTLDGKLKQLQHTIEDVAETWAGELAPAMGDFAEATKFLVSQYDGVRKFMGLFEKFSMLDMMMPINQIKMFRETLQKLGITAKDAEESLTGFHNLVSKPPGLIPPPELKSLDAWFDEFAGTTDIAREEAWKFWQAIQAINDIIPEFSTHAKIFRDDLDAMGAGIKEVSLVITEDFNEAQMRYIGFMQGMLLPGLYNMANALFAGGNAWQNFANAAVDALKRIMVQMVALAALSAILSAIPGVGQFGQLFKMFAGINWQTPKGDWWAQKEGRDFGKFFMDGFQTSFVPMLQGVNMAQQPMNVVVHTGDPSTYVEFMRKLPTQYKSKLYREVTIPGRNLEG